MSNVNISRAIDNIRHGTNVYTPLVEVIVNAVQAVEQSKNEEGLIEVLINRIPQAEIEGLASVDGFVIKDNGIGFTDLNRDAFDTLYTDYKITEGGKGFGRFTCLKYFENMLVESIYENQGVFYQRKFKMGRENEIIIDEKLSETEKTDTGSVVYLDQIRKIRFTDKSLEAIAKSLLEKLLPYFFSDKLLPKIVLKEADGSEEVVLNDYLSTQNFIQEINSANGEFLLSGIDKKQAFSVRVFKFYSAGTQKSKISLVAHRREVNSTSIYTYIPEFIEEFFDKDSSGKRIRNKNFIIKVYVSSIYLDDHVSLERGGFEFQKENDVIFGISQIDIEIEASKYAKKAVEKDVSNRVERKTERINKYVNEKAPWHSQLVSTVDLSNIPYNATNAQIESILQVKKFEQDTKMRNEVNKLLSDESKQTLHEKATDIVQMISDSNKNDLTHYIALRRSVIDLLEKSLEIDEGGKYSSEGIVHDIIFPRKGDSIKTNFKDHNLWLVDERLNFSQYISSDIPLQGNSDRPDLIAYNHRVVFRGENEASNPVTIFEFKKPQRHDFANPSSDEDPVQQVIRYVRQLRAGDFNTPKGREILITDNTPFYGFVICDIPTKIKSWLAEEHDFKPMPDGLGFFKWHGNLNLYIEVISWDKVLKDAAMRNRIFFHKLGIEMV